MSSDILYGLNDEQREAVLTTDSHLLVLAGAGSGKTRVITTKLAYYIKELGFRPWEILAVTFTNKAAREMKERVMTFLPDLQPNDFNVMTFHSFGAGMLRRWGDRLNLAPGFCIYDDEDSLSLLASCFPDMKKKELSPYMKLISKAKDLDFSCDENLEAISRDPDFPRFYKTYEKRLREVGNADFADLIRLPYRLLKDDRDVRNYYHRKFRLVLVDEYQDSNRCQFRLLRELVSPDCQLVVVGDDDQSIYRFRGAEIKNILNFPQDYPGTKIIKLEQNYRSTASIIDLASTIISHNRNRHDKTMRTDNPKGTLPRVWSVADEKAEAETVLRLIQQKKDYNDCAIIYRTNAQSAEFENLFLRNSVPYRLLGALKFYQREEIKDSLALLDLVVNGKDEVSFRRMVNKPARGLGKVTIDKIADASVRTGGDFIRSCSLCLDEKIVKGAAGEKLKSFLDAIEGCRKEMQEGELKNAIVSLLENSHLVLYYNELDKKEHTDRVSNLSEFVNGFAGLDGIQGVIAFLEKIALDSSSENDDSNIKEGVSLVTMHNAKGLEFRRVFIAGVEDELIPGRIEETDDEIEEERRLFYVAVTRAREELNMFCARRRMIWGDRRFSTPSRFLNEIKPDQIEKMGFGSYGSGYMGMGSLGQRRFNHDNGSDRPYYMSQNAPSWVKDVYRPEKTNVKSSPDKHYFDIGQMVLSEQYGKGEVVSLKKRGEREVIDVQFFSGRRVTYISEVAKLEKIEE